MKRIIILLISLLIPFISCAQSESASEQLREKYAEAELLLVEGQYDEAAAKFDSLGSYSDSSKMAMYCKAISAAENYKLYTIAVDTLSKLNDFKDSAQLAIYYTGRGNEEAGDLILSNLKLASDDDLNNAETFYENAEKMYQELMLFKDCMIRAALVAGNKEKIEAEIETRNDNKIESSYQKALALEDESKWDEAITVYETIISYKDCKDRIIACKQAISNAHYDLGINLREKKQWDAAIQEFTSAAGYKDAENQIYETYYQKALALRESKNWDSAIDVFTQIGNYSDAKAQISETIYQKGVNLLTQKEWDQAIAVLSEVSEYSNSNEKIKEAYYGKGLSLRKNKKWTDAIDSFRIAKDYEDANTQITETLYQQARHLCKSKEFKRALNIYHEIQDYKDVIEIIPSIIDSARDEAQKAFTEPYGTVILGKYEQDGNTQNGTEDIEWIVLTVQKDKALLLSLKILDTMGHNAAKENDWGTSKIHEWLNNDFYTTSFSPEEKKHIIATKLSNKSIRKTKSWNSTTDIVFLLSEEEVKKYLPNPNDRIAGITKYVYENAYKEGYTFVDQRSLTENSNGEWWLRSTGDNSWNFLYVARKDGRSFGVGEIYCCADSANEGIRPAIWIIISDFY